MGEEIVSQTRFLDGRQSGLEPGLADKTALAPYRVLDLTEDGSLICGKVLGDLGADVIVVEKPGGSPSRRIGPFYKGIPDPEKSLSWFAYNTNKRSITLDIESRDGHRILGRLAKTADFIVESFPAGYLDSIGLGYGALSSINSRIILTSITPFGQTGPKAKWKSCDLTKWASGGMLYVNGDRDRPPNCLSFPQAALHAGVEAAVASLIAHWVRETTGIGQHVDVSAQQSVTWTTMNVTSMWDFGKQSYLRSSSDWTVSSTGVRIPWIFPCKDGYVCYTVRGGGAAFHVASTRAMVKWMHGEGMAPDWLKDFDWVGAYDVSKLSQNEVERVQEPFRRFLMNKHKDELFKGALERGILLAPVNTMKDVCHDAQLEARGYWSKVPHDELGENVTYCGPFIRLSETAISIRRRPPLIGEHNIDIYRGELGLSQEELMVLKQGGVI